MSLIPTGVTRKWGSTVLKTKKNSPHIFFVGGVVGILGGTILACRSTLKLDKELDQIKTEVEDVKSLYRDSENMEREYYRDLGHVYMKGTIKLGRLYGPALILGSAGVAAITGSHIQMTKRNTALTVTLAAVSKAFDEYRIRVAEEIGEERELEIHRAMAEEQREIEGKKTKVQVVDPNGLSPYARFFDECSPYWQKDPELNRIFIQCQQSYFNDRLHAYGHVFLNEVYDALGMERTRAGAVVGWFLDGVGDGFVDFGLFEPKNAMFVNGVERNVLLDFNVDGVIYDKI